MKLWIDDHEQTMRWIIKNKLSFIHSRVDKIPLQMTGDAILRLLEEMQQFLSPQLEEHK